MKQKKQVLASATEFLKKYRYAALILLLGVVLLLIPTGKKTAEESPQETEQVEQEETLEERLGALLSQVDGAGCVSVMLTQKTGEETVYQTDSVTDGRQEDGATSQTVTITTVLASDGSSGETALVTEVRAPQYLGAVIVAEGGDLPSIRLNLVNAVSSLTGLGADKITVMKMRAN